MSGDGPLGAELGLELGTPLDGTSDCFPFGSFGQRSEPRLGLIKVRCLSQVRRLFLKWVSFACARLHQDTSRFFTSLHGYITPLSSRHVGCATRLSCEATPAALGGQVCACNTGQALSLLHARCSCGICITMGGQPGLAATSQPCDDAQAEQRAAQLWPDVCKQTTRNETCLILMHCFHVNAVSSSTIRSMLADIPNTAVMCVRLASWPEHSEI